MEVKVYATSVTEYNLFNNERKRLGPPRYTTTCQKQLILIVQDSCEFKRKQHELRSVPLGNIQLNILQFIKNVFWIEHFISRKGSGQNLHMSVWHSHMYKLSQY